MSRGFSEYLCNELLTQDTICRQDVGAPLETGKQGEAFHITRLLDLVISHSL